MKEPVLRYKHDDFEIVVRTDDIAGAWERFQGRINYRKGWKATTSQPKAYCTYKASEECSVELFDYETGTLSTIEQDKELWPVIFETNSYHISVRFNGIDPEFEPKAVHVRKEVVDSFYYDYDKLSGEINFLNEPGLFRMGFQYSKGGKIRESWIEFYVASPKLDVKDDYKSILDAVNREFGDLIFRYTSLTVQQFGKGKDNRLEVWMHTFQEVVDHYLKNVDRIIKSPNSRTRTIELNAHADRIKKWTPAMEEEYEETRSAGKLEEHYFSYEVYDNTINTLENRFVKYSLKQIEKKLGFVFEKILNRNATEISQAHREQWESYSRLIHKYLKHPFFKSVGNFEGLRQESLVLQSRMGYQQVYKDWLKLKRGIDFYQGATNVGTLQIWEIYELWCFLKVKKMVLNILRISEDSPLVSEPNGPIITYQQDSKAAREKDYRICIAYPAVEDTMEPEKNAGDKGFADYLKKHEGDSISIHYQHTYSRIRKDDMGMMSMTTEQRPDIVLNIIKADGNVLTYLYDAKYRVWSDRNLDVTDDWIEQDEDMVADFKGADYPPADAINQMHRYRDSIYYCGDEDKLRKEIVGGYILFPGRGDDESIARRFYSQSISRINIGAFPLLPSGEEVTTANDPEGPQLFTHLNDILLKRVAYNDHIKDAVPQRGLIYDIDGE